MSYETYEEGTCAGAPIELYDFSRSTTHYRYTSDLESVSYGGFPYAPEQISRNQITHSREDRSGRLEVTVPADNTVAQLFSDFLPVPNVSLIIYRKHRDDAETLAIFNGTVVSVQFSDGLATLTCLPVSEQLRRNIPTQVYQRQCNHPLYGDGCGLTAGDWDISGEVLVVDDLEITVEGLDGEADGYWTHGWLQRSNGDLRWIVRHTGEVVTLMSEMGVIVGETVTVYAGCDRSEDTCADKFDNLDNFSGWTRVPNKNPFSEPFD